MSKRLEGDSENHKIRIYILTYRFQWFVSFFGGPFFLCPVRATEYRQTFGSWTRPTLPSYRTWVPRLRCHSVLAWRCEVGPTVSETEFLLSFFLSSVSLSPFFSFCSVFSSFSVHLLCHRCFLTSPRRRHLYSSPILGWTFGSHIRTETQISVYSLLIPVSSFPLLWSTSDPLSLPNHSHYGCYSEVNPFPPSSLQPYPFCTFLCFGSLS